MLVPGKVVAARITVRSPTQCGRSALCGHRKGDEGFVLGRPRYYPVSHSRFRHVKQFAVLARDFFARPHQASHRLLPEPRAFEACRSWPALSDVREHRLLRTRWTYIAARQPE